MLIDKTIRYLILGVVLTIPLIFGAVHPIILGCYVFVILVGCGGWLIFRLVPEENANLTFWIYVPLLLISYTIFQSIPLPLEVVESLSANRAERIQMVNELAGTNLRWATLSDNGITGLYRSFFFFSLLLYYFCLCRILSKDHRFLTKLIFCLIAIGTFEALYGILQFLKPQLGLLWLDIKTRAAHGTIIYKNQYASMLNMLWPIAVTGGALYLIRETKKTRHGAKHKKNKNTIDPFTATRSQATLFLFGAAAIIIAVIFSLSRGGILSMTLVGLLLIIMLPFSPRSKRLFLTFWGFIIFGYVALLGIENVITRFGSFGRSGSGRLDIYIGSIPMLTEHWLTGVGLGSFELLSPVYLKGFPGNILFSRVHNEYLEIMIELGIPFGTLCFCWIWGGMINLLVRLLGAMKYNRLNINMKALGVASFCGLFGFLVHGIVDFGWRLPANLIYATTLLAILMHILRYPVVTQIKQESRNAK